MGAVATSQQYHESGHGWPGKWALMSSADPKYMSCHWSGDPTVALAGLSYGGNNNPQWWQVDLGAEYRITEIDIYGTSPGTHYNQGVVPKVCTADGGSSCSDCGTATLAAGLAWDGNTCDLTGRYLRLEKLLVNQNWHFCRVRVLGELAATESPTLQPTPAPEDFLQKCAVASEGFYLDNGIAKACFQPSHAKTRTCDGPGAENVLSVTCDNKFKRSGEAGKKPQL
jgi:hypothetical protein